MSDFWMGFFAFPSILAFIFTVKLLSEIFFDYLEKRGLFLIFGWEYPEESDTKFNYVKIKRHKLWATGVFHNTYWGSLWLQTCGVCIGVKKDKWSLDNMRPDGVGSLP